MAYRAVVAGVDSSDEEDDEPVFEPDLEMVTTEKEVTLVQDVLMIEGSNESVSN